MRSRRKLYMVLSEGMVAEVGKVLEGRCVGCGVKGVFAERTVGRIVPVESVPSVQGVACGVVNKLPVVGTHDETFTHE